MRARARPPTAREIVRAGYDAVSYQYRGDDATDVSYETWLAELSAGLPAGGSVLDLGCGCGVPAARWLVGRGFTVTGVDISQVQIERARGLVPEARFVVADMTDVEFDPASFDAVVCLYAIIHVPLGEQPGVIASWRRWLRPGGALLATVGAEAWTGTEENWLGGGATMYWSHAGRETYLRWLAEAGLRIRWNRFIPEGDGGHTLVVAEASSGSV